MEFKKSDCKVETMRGTGPGGQHRNKTDSACRVTHIPTGVTAYCDERSQATSKRKAFKELRDRLKSMKEGQVAAEKKKRRDHAIHNTKTIRTYDFKSGVVKDHRSKKTASVKDILGKGRIELLR
jgi:peptide chain release factor 1